jgi:hypothetical protein
MLRFTICVALGLEAAFWLYLAGTGVADNLDFARGTGHWVAIAATAVLVLLAFPALTLAVYNLRMRLAAILTAVVALLYAYPFVASLPKLSNGTLGLWALLAAVLIGCGAIWNRPRADEAPSEPLSNAQVQHRITFLYGAELLTLICSPASSRWSRSGAPALPTALKRSSRSWARSSMSP